LNRASPGDIILNVDGWSILLVDHFGGVANGNNRLSCALMSINDRMGTSEEEREFEITKLFAKEGITVKFIG
jgi:hypothetical protein